MQVVWAMLLGPLCGGRAAEAAAGATVFAFFPLLLLVVYGWARERHVDATWAAIAAAMVAAIPTATTSRAAGTSITPSPRTRRSPSAAFARWWVTLDRAFVMPIALALGGALSIKLTAAFLLVPARPSRARPRPHGDAQHAGPGACGRGPDRRRPGRLRSCSPWFSPRRGLRARGSGRAARSTRSTRAFGPEPRLDGMSSAPRSIRVCSRCTATRHPSTISSRLFAWRSARSPTSRPATTACSASHSCLPCRCPLGPRSRVAGHGALRSPR